MSRPPACRSRSSSACPKRPSRRARTASSGRWSTRAFNARKAASSSTCAPADLPKDAASFDLPIALGTLIGSGQVASELLAQYAVVGELALDGSTRPTKGRPLDGHGRRPRSKKPPRADRAGRKRGGSGRRRRHRSHRRASLAQAVGLPCRAKSRSSRPPRGWTTCSANWPTTTSISPTSAGRKWPSGRSSSRPPADTIC